jgi:hypothetical protein
MKLFLISAQKIPSFKLFIRILCAKNQCHVKKQKRDFGFARRATSATRVPDCGRQRAATKFVHQKTIPPYRA